MENIQKRKERQLCYGVKNRKKGKLGGRWRKPTNFEGEEESIGNGLISVNFSSDLSQERLFNFELRRERLFTWFVDNKRKRE